MTASELLASLHTAVVDARNGYEEAMERAELPDVKAVFQKLKTLHENAHAELHEALLAKGLSPDDSGSFMTTVHKTVISVRTAFTALDDKSLSAFASGEERIIEDYDKAIEVNADDGPLVALLERQKNKLTSEISEMSAIAASAAKE